METNILEHEIETLETFHNEFEQEFDIDSSIRQLFKNDWVLMFIRRAFLRERNAAKLSQFSKKLFCFYTALEELQKIDLSIPTIKSEVKLYVRHNIAKIYYEIGVLWMTWTDSKGKNYKHFFTDQETLQKFFSSETSANQHAIACFEKACNSYDNLLNEEFFISSISSHKEFENLDQFTPLARIISIKFNLYKSTELEDKNRALEILTELKSYIVSSKKYENLNEASRKSINQVESYLDRKSQKRSIVFSSETNVEKKSKSPENGSAATNFGNNPMAFMRSSQGNPNCSSDNILTIDTSNTSIPINFFVLAAESAHNTAVLLCQAAGETVEDAKAALERLPDVPEIIEATKLAVAAHNKAINAVTVANEATTQAQTEKTLSAEYAVKAAQAAAEVASAVAEAKSAAVKATVVADNKDAQFLLYLGSPK